MRFTPNKCLATALIGASLVLVSVSANAYENALFALKNRWEHTVTQTPKSEREENLKALAEEVQTLAKQHSDAADVLIWQGVVLASYAREQGGLGALGSAKEARDALERAIELDPAGNNGSAYVTLGALYDRVPGGLISFGDSETAERMFQRALDIRPDGIDVNYYYASFLEEEGNTQAAKAHAQRAVNGTAREGRKASDEALRNDAKALLGSL
ncbi:TRAP transporter TatT component family protein [Vreelandella massiliensis]|uniref:TRAP transporter TatT component family protein n=1 Tax=Vreelandella massiliensis TaxID=1816686 RepID=UPI00096A3491|nr:TRAP transporter TatT component family protein [Halomonas massiliensis]